MGPARRGGGPITTTNTATDLSSWPTFDNTQGSFAAGTARTAIVEVSFSGLVEAIELYNSSWAGTVSYSAFSYNSNYAVNTVIYAAGGTVPGGFWAPEFRSPTMYYSPNPYNNRN